MEQFLAHTGIGAEGNLEGLGNPEQLVSSRCPRSLGTFLSILLGAILQIHRCLPSVMRLGNVAVIVHPVKDSSFLVVRTPGMQPAFPCRRAAFVVRPPLKI